MANERSSRTVDTCTKSGQTVTLDSTKITTLTGTGNVTFDQDIGFAADEQIVFPAGIIAEGITRVAVKNLDATNFVRLSTGTGGGFAAAVFAKLLAGETISVPVNRAAASDPTWYAQADTAACDIQVVAFGT